MGKEALGLAASPEKNADSLAEGRLNKVCLGRARALGCTMSCRGGAVRELQARTQAAKRNGAPGPASRLLSPGTLEVLAPSQAFPISLSQALADIPSLLWSLLLIGCCQRCCTAESWSCYMDGDPPGGLCGIRGSSPYSNGKDFRQWHVLTDGCSFCCDMGK